MCGVSTHDHGAAETVLDEPVCLGRSRPGADADAMNDLMGVLRTFVGGMEQSSLLCRPSDSRRFSSIAAILDAMKASMNSCDRWPTMQGMVSRPWRPKVSTGRNEITEREIGRVF